jgi:hypothetical protein
MTRRIISEGFDYHDLVNQIVPEIQVDEYSAKMGSDDEIVTISFTVKGRQVGEDLVDWLERGYDYVLDAQVSDGEITSGKYLVFVELNRRSTVPERICEMIEDMETLTDLPLKEWTIKVNDESYDADIEQLKSVIILSPHQYRMENEEEINEMRNLSGLEKKKIFGEPDSELKNYLAKAGL